MKAPGAELGLLCLVQMQNEKRKGVTLERAPLPPHILSPGSSLLCTFGGAPRTMDNWPRGRQACQGALWECPALCIFLGPVDVSAEESTLGPEIYVSN